MVTPSFFKNRCTRFLSLSRIPSKGRAVTTCPTCRLLLRKTPTATAAKLMMRVSGSKGRSRCSCAIKLANTLSCGLIIVASVVQGGFCVATIVAVPGCGGYTLLNCGLTSTVPQSDRTPDNWTPVVVQLYGPLAMFVERIGWPEKDSEFHQVGTCMEGVSIRQADGLMACSVNIADFTASYYGVPRE